MGAWPSRVTGLLVGLHARTSATTGSHAERESRLTSPFTRCRAVVLPCSRGLSDSLRPVQSQSRELRKELVQLGIDDSTRQYA